jgi:uncharacterized protein (TIGR03437 family)
MKSFLKGRREFRLFPVVIMIAALGCADAAVAQSAGVISVTPTSLNFCATPGESSAPASQTLTFTSTASTRQTFTLTPVTNTGNWLSVSPAEVTVSSTSPATATVSVDLEGLLHLGESSSEGLFHGLVSAEIPFGPVFVVAQGTALDNSNSSGPVLTSLDLDYVLGSLTFADTQGGPAPSAQSFSVLGCGNSGPVTVTATTSSSLVTINPATATLPPGGSATFSAAINPVALPGLTVAGSPYAGTITLLAASLGAATVPYTINVGGPKTPLISGAVNGANFLPYSFPGISTATGSASQPTISPGETMTIQGVTMGPATGESFTETSQGTIPTNVGGVGVNFSIVTPSSAERAPADTAAATPAATTTVAAPLLYVSSTQINAIVPYEVAGSSTVNMSVTYNGNTSQPFPISVVPTNPAIFSLTGTGYGQGAILNQDYSVNGFSNPAAKGSYVSVYCTGEGVLTPQPATGSVTPSTGTSFPLPVGKVSLTIGGIPAQILYAGETPGDTSGLLQVTAYVPTGLAAGPQPVVLTVGANSSASQVVIMYVH